MSDKTPNQTTANISIRKGLSIYKTGQSPYWKVRLRDSSEGRYVTRTTKETSRIEAREAAEEFAASFARKANSDIAQKTVTSFGYYADQMLRMQKSKRTTHDSDRKLLYRQKDGIIRHFGDYDVSKITTRMIREYLLELDGTREKPLAESTRAKHIIIIRKVLTLAVEDGLIKQLPAMPKQKTKDAPRNAFTPEQYKQFMKVGANCARLKETVRGVQITGHHVRMFRFLVHSFLRPTKGELFGLKHKDITVESDPAHLVMTVRGGKTGKRVSVTMSLCVLVYKGMLNPGDIDKEAYVWMPEYSNRDTAINTARRIFNYILEKAGLADSEHKLSPYSLRHYALQARIRGSNGKVNIHTLASNAGTSVDQLERFYLKGMAPTKGMIKNLQWTED